MPDHLLCRALVQAFGAPIAATSANRSGQASPRTAQEAAEQVGDAVDVILDGGACPVGRESTVVDLTVHPPVILRPGKITPEQIGKALGQNVAISKKPVIARSPGMKYRHYSPRAKVIVVVGAGKSRIIKGLIRQHRQSAVISLGKKYSGTKSFVSPTLHHYARHLFHNFRECDRLGKKTIIVEGIAEHGLGHAIMNRVRKSASRIIQS